MQILVHSYCARVPLFDQPYLHAARLLGAPAHQIHAFSVSALYRKHTGVWIPATALALGACSDLVMPHMQSLSLRHGLFNLQ
jgi:hypothetical protein